MGLLKKLIGNAVSEGIGKGISSAVEKATEKIVAPAAEKWANKTADQLDSATEAMETVEKETGKPFGSAFERLEKAAENYAAAAEKAASNYAAASVDAAWSSKFSVFPKWDYTPIRDVSTDEGDDYLVFSVYAEATEEMINDYRARLDKEGFTGDMQIRSKTIGDERYVVDFSFAEYSEENEIRYAIEKK